MGVSDLDLLAASLRADASDIRAFVETLATKLLEAFPGHVLVERHGSRLRGGKRVRRIVLPLVDDRFELDHDDGRVVCRRSAMVRGIALRTEQLELDDWLDLLSRSLVTEAETSERGRDAFPNPAETNINFTFPENAKGASFIIYDALGREFSASTIQNTQLNVNTSSFEAGQYFFRYVNKVDGTVMNGKFIVTK